MREGGIACGVDTGTWFLCLKSNTQVTAKHKTTATAAERAITMIIPPLSPSLCRFFRTSTPRGLFALALLSIPGYGPPSIMVMPVGEGGDWGRPKISEVLYKFLDEYNEKCLIHKDNYKRLLDKLSWSARSILQ